MHFIATDDSCDFQASKTNGEDKIKKKNKIQTKVPIGKPHNGLSGES